MPFDLAALLNEYQGQSFDLHSQFMNPQLVKVLKTLGFDRQYVGAEGSYLIDDQGDRYLDFLSGFGVFALGRSHPVIKDALHQAIDADLPNLVQLDCALLPGLLAKALVERSPTGIERVFFTNSGAETVETAIKFARCSTGRDRILYCDHAFHGLTNGALSLNGGKEFRQGFGPLLPHCDQVPFGDIDALRRQLRRGDVAAFVVEPIQGKGVYMAPACLLGRGRGAVPAPRDPAGHGRGADRYGADRSLLLPSALGPAPRHHHGVQGPLGRVHAGGCGL